MNNIPIFMNIINAYPSLLFWMAKIHSNRIMKIAILILYLKGVLGIGLPNFLARNAPVSDLD